MAEKSRIAQVPIYHVLDNVHLTKSRVWDQNKSFLNDGGASERERAAMKWAPECALVRSENGLEEQKKDCPRRSSLDILRAYY